MTVYALENDVRRPTSKYKAKPTVVDGIRFHSQKEARRYQELRLLEKAGEIRNLRLQPAFDLYAMRPLNTRGEQDYTQELLGCYKGDFAYETSYRVHREGKVYEHWRGVVEDVKGFKTPLYKWKKKHVEAQYGIEIREI